MPPNRLLFSILAATWCVAVAAGFSILLRYKAIPGDQGTVSSQWPDDSGIARVPACYNLVMALHPHCPCSAASVAELEKILAQSGKNVRVQVLIYRPSGRAEGWEESDLVREVRRIPGVLLHLDEDAVEAERFGALTSGQIVLYGISGELLFRGGITASRGHMGATPSQDAVQALLRGRPSDLSSAPVFGCSLRNPACRQEQR
jgi:hypothetical protein